MELLPTCLLWGPRLLWGPHPLWGPHFLCRVPASYSGSLPPVGSPPPLGPPPLMRELLCLLWEVSSPGGVLIFCGGSLLPVQCPHLWWGPHFLRKSAHAVGGILAFSGGSLPLVWSPPPVGSPCLRDPCLLWGPPSQLHLVLLPVCCFLVNNGPVLTRGLPSPTPHNPLQTLCPTT